MAFVAAKMPRVRSLPPSLAQFRRFEGVDLTNQPGNVGPSRSPEAPNMIRAVPGKVRKRKGWHTIGKLAGRVNGFHPLTGKDPLIHAGTGLYRLPGGCADGMAAPVKLYDQAADSRSKSWEFGEKLYIADGKALLVYDGEAVKPASEGAKIPVLTIGKPAAGGGTQYEALNLLQPKFTELFLATESDKVFQLSFGSLDAAPVEAEILAPDGSWQKKTEGSGFSVNRQTGQVTFVTEPGKSPIAGQDNVKITASRTVAGYADRVNHCTIGMPFGVNGAADRLFLSGNPAFRNYDWYSGMNDPTYWEDVAYSVLGQSDSAVVGYCIVADRLAAVKDAPAAERNVIVRQGNLVDSKPSFPICNMLQGEGAVAPYSFGYLENEPIFLTKLGLFALTTADITGEKYAQNRSFYLNGKMLKEENLQDSFALVYKDLYLLALNGKVYVLDGQQPAPPERQAPYSTRQLSAFLLTDIPARVLWQEGEVLYFGSPDGSVRAFYEDETALTSYNDDGRPVRASWRLPDLAGRQFYHNKDFSYLYVELAAAAATSIVAKARVDGVWDELFRDDSTARYFDWGNIDWSKWTWSSDNTPRTVGGKIRIRKVDKAGFLVENEELNEPFGLESIALEFVESGYHK